MGGQATSALLQPCLTRQQDKGNSKAILYQFQADVISIFSDFV